MNDTRAHSLPPSVWSLAGRVAFLVLGMAACEQPPLTVTEDQLVPLEALSTTRQELTLAGPITPIEPIGPIIPRCPPLRIVQPPGSFQFDNGTAQDWSMQGLFDGDTATRLVQMNATPAIWWDRTNAPGAPFSDPLNNNLGSLLFFTAGGFAAAPSGFWREDFVSPDLTNRAGWQTTNRFSFQINEGMSALVPLNVTAIHAQLLAEVEKCDGTTTFLRQVNAAGSPVFCPVTPDTWVTCTFTLTMNQVHHLKRLHIRIFGDTRAAYEGSLFIDSVRAL
jgi:hypothetical protein